MMSQFASEPLKSVFKIRKLINGAPITLSESGKLLVTDTVRFPIHLSIPVSKS